MLNNSPKIYRINLNHATERRDKMITQFQEFPQIISQRVEAIHGDSIETNPNVLYNTSIKKSVQQKRASGCSASHIKAIKTYLEDQENTNTHALITEDDLSFETISYWKYDWKTYFEIINKDFDVVKMCNCSLPHNVIKSFNDFKEGFKPVKIKGIYKNGTCIYLISRKYAQQLINHYYKEDKINFSNHIPIADYFLYNSAKTYYFPLFIYQKLYKSYISSKQSSFEKINKARDLHLQFIQNL